MTGELINHTWQSTVFAVAAGLMTLGFRQNRAAVRYGLWLSASVKFLLPVFVIKRWRTSLGVSSGEAGCDAAAQCRAFDRTGERTFSEDCSSDAVDARRSQLGRHRDCSGMGLRFRHARANALAGMVSYSGGGTREHSDV